MKTILEGRIRTLSTKFKTMKSGLERERVRGHLAEAWLIYRLVELGVEGEEEVSEAANSTPLGIV